MKRRTAMFLSILVSSLAILTDASGSRAAADMPRPFGSESWRELAATAADRPLIVHFWSLTCSVCMAELPEWGRFMARQPGARIVLVNWDRRLEDTRGIDAALAKAGITTRESWYLADAFESKLRFGIDRGWIGELPYTRLVARDGSQSSSSGGADFAKLSAWIDQQAK